MKLLLTLMVFLGSMSLLMAAEMRIINTKSGKEIELNVLARELAKYQIIFFGEYHDNATIHDLQKELLPLLHKRRPRLILSFEMFERDVQTYMNQYLNGDMSEADFLLNSRPWPNYDPDYKPLLDFARDRGLKSIAANVPRYLAGRSVRNSDSFMTTLSDQERTYVATMVNAPEDRYKELFMQTMQANAAHGMPGDESMYQRIYYAQCVKDDTMAESIVNAYDSNKKSTILHFNGDFHSRFYLGTVQRVMQRRPKLKVAVISPEYVAEFDSYTWEKDHRQIADFLILLPAVALGEEQL